MKGIVKWYNARKGYGFITPEDKSDDVFVHAITLKSCGLNKLYTGSEITFEVDQDEKGKRAKNLKVTKEVKPEFKTDKKESPADKEQKPIDKQEKKASNDKESVDNSVKTKPKKEEKSNKKTKSKPKSKPKPKSKSKSK